MTRTPMHMYSSSRARAASYCAGDTAMKSTWLHPICTHRDASAYFFIIFMTVAPTNGLNCQHFACMFALLCISNTSHPRPVEYKFLHFYSQKFVTHDTVVYGTVYCMIRQIAQQKWSYQIRTKKKKKKALILWLQGFRCSNEKSQPVTDIST